MNKLITILIIAFILISCDPAWIYKINTPGYSTTDKLTYNDEFFIFDATAGDFAFQTHIMVKLFLKKDSVKIYPFYAYFKSQKNEYIHIPYWIYISYKKIDNLDLNIKTEINNLNQAKSQFSHIDSLLYQNPSYEMTSSIAEDIRYSHTNLFDLYNQSITTNKGDSLEIEFIFPSFAYHFDGKSDSSSFAIYYSLNEKSKPIKLNFEPI